MDDQRGDGEEPNRHRDQVVRDRREALGDVIRIVVAAPGSLTGRYPEVNTAASPRG